MHAKVAQSNTLASFIALGWVVALAYNARKATTRRTRYWQM
jgi:hypothetical protein